MAAESEPRVDARPCDGDDPLDGLRPFQRATVDRVVRLFEELGRRRVLVADEVGLGKTLIARGVIAKLAAHRHGRGEGPLRVAYICSNGNIIEQNLRKLVPDGDERGLAGASLSRLSMQHLHIYRNERDPERRGASVHLIPLTPGTSFQFNAGQGLCEERALIYAVLSQYEPFRTRRHRLDALEAMFRKLAPSSWPLRREAYESMLFGSGGSGVGDADFYRDYLESMNRHLDARREELEPFIAYLDARRDSTGDLGQIGAIRQVFAEIGIDCLEPDLIVMDEFQRYRELLDAPEDSDLKLVVSKFFTDRSSARSIRMLLLSATPFKALSTYAEELDRPGESSSGDFLRVMDFLISEGAPEAEYREEDRTGFRDVWSDYEGLLSKYLGGGPGDREVSDGLRERVIRAKDRAAVWLGGYLSRTERIALDEYDDLVRDCSEEEMVQAEAGDVAAFLMANRLFDRLGVNRTIPVEYGESCPFLLSYLQGYKMEGDFRRRLGAVGVDDRDSIPYLSDGDPGWRRLWVDPKAVNSYRDIGDPSGVDGGWRLGSLSNSRFERFKRDVFEADFSSDPLQDASSLLWVPPSRPYYLVEEGPFAAAPHFTKTLVFSSWTMVPRMMATLLSYEDERRSVVRAHGDRPSYTYTGEARDEDEDDDEVDVDRDDPKLLPHGRMKFFPSRGSGVGYNAGTESLLLPARGLAGLVHWPERAEDATFRTLRDDVERTLRERLEGRVPERGDSGVMDLRWYARAMFLIEEAEGFDGELDGFLKRLSSLGELADSDDHLCAAVRKLAQNWESVREMEPGDLGRVPDDLYTVLSEVAIGSPALCALRTFDLCRADDGADRYLQALRFALAFRARMNTSESTLALDAAIPDQSLHGAEPAGTDGRAGAVERRTRSSHWFRLLRYCCLGNLQAVLDEYGHQLGFDRGPGRLCDLMVGGRVGLHRQPTLYNVNGHYNVETPANCWRRAFDPDARSEPLSMRHAFATAFIEDDRSKGQNRRELIRRAFNSPFRPFVLCSTSIGQEGLDFHSYCRRIVHWNLPHNPIEIEQREGRVNRYECLAVRQNVVQRFDQPLRPGEDLWEKVFAKAREDAERRYGDDYAGIAPHWGLPAEEPAEDPGAGAERRRVIPIERHTYLRKYSVAEGRYRHLIDSLSRYRAVLGQPRQEELLARLADLPADEVRRLFMDLSPFNAARARDDEPRIGP